MIGILLNPDDGDFLMGDDGMLVGDNTSQVAEHVLVATPGDYKEFPLLGAAVINLQNANSDAFWAVDAKAMLNECGIKVSHVSIDDDGIISIE